MRQGIYQIRCVPTKKVYVGSAIWIEKRWAFHRFHLRSGTHGNRYLQSAWIKHKEENFRFELLEIVPDKKLLIDREQFWIDKKRLSTNLFNLTFKAMSALGREWTTGEKKQASIKRRNALQDQASLELEVRGPSVNMPREYSVLTP